LIREAVRTARSLCRDELNNLESNAHDAPAPARIQSATARSIGGTVAKDSFAARAQSAAAHNGSGKSGGNK
jgi:hypothetical protein